MESLTDIRQRLEARYSVGRDTTTPVLALPPADPASLEQAFVVDGPDRTVITGPAEVLDPEKAAAWEKASVANPLFKYIQGNYVEADRPNRNNAFWTTADLEMGQASVAGGPLNWLHNDQKIIGAVLDSHLHYAPEGAAAGGAGNHIKAIAAVWDFMYPAETRVIERAGRERVLWYSMECVSKTVTCTDAPGRPGCGASFDWRTYKTEKAKLCGHLQQNSSVRHLSDPTFLGGAVILPPVEPGWMGASASVMGTAGRIAEAASLENVMDREAAEAMVAMVLTYAGATQSE